MTWQGMPGRKRRGEGKGGGRNLGLGLDADVEGLDAGGEGAGDELAGEGVEEVEARLGEAEEAAPLLDDGHVGLLHAPAEEEEGAHHLLPRLGWLTYLPSLPPSAGGIGGSVRRSIPAGVRRGGFRWVRGV